MSNSQLCSVCSSLKLQRHDFETPPFEPEGRYHSLVSTGSLGHLRSNEKECPLCRLILYALHKNEGHILDEQSDETQWEMTWSQNIYEYEPETDEAQDSYGSGLYPELKIEGSNTDHCIQLVDEASTDGFLRGREIPETIDPEMIQGWMQRCMKMHGHDCIPSHLEVAPHPAATMEFMAIDVHKECLVNILPTDEYAALSYVWGQANHLTTVKSVLSEFKTPGAFNRTKPPRTIRDAMDLTRVLGFEYLWVDALCIIQDEGETKQLLISNMDAVYGHAALTLIAASGIDADAGLSGWKATSPERQTCIESMGSDWKLGVLPSFEPSLMNTPYAQRGWTYQEGCLSPRCLVFLSGRVFLSCRASIWREDIMAEVEDVRTFEGANTLGRAASEWPLRRYSQAVGAYTSRQLTHQSDILNAFSGIAKAMTVSMASTKMFYAMPAVAFDWAILWTGHLMDRKLKCYDGFPSWAWVGRKGEIMMAGDTYSSLDHHWLLERTWIEWYITLENGETVLMWDPERDQTVISPLAPSSSHSTLDGSEKARSENFERGESSTIDNELNGEGSSTVEDDTNNPSEESDEEDEEEFCPTYDSPSTNNPYGRNIKSKLLSVLPERPNSMHLKPWPQSRLSPGTLSFSTVIATFAMDSQSSPTTRGTSIFKLRDSANRVCGFIWDDSEPARPAKPMLQSREIILLSQASPGTTYGMNEEEAGFAEEYRMRKMKEEALDATSGEVELDGEYILDEWHSWDFFNVMLVVRFEDEERGKNEGCVYEREGIGFVHKNALVHALNPKLAWRMIHLG